MNLIPRISDSEWSVMKVVWAAPAPVSAAYIIAALNERERWHPKTVKTLINRLVKKGALTFNKEGREYLYRATVSEKACARAESQSFLDRVFGGTLQPMLAQLVEEKRLSAQEIKELKRILNGKQKE